MPPKPEWRVVDLAIVQPLSELDASVSGGAFAPLSLDGEPLSLDGEPPSTGVAAHVVSAPVAMSPAARVVPEGHGTQTWLATD